MRIPSNGMINPAMTAPDQLYFLHDFRYWTEYISG